MENPSPIAEPDNDVPEFGQTDGTEKVKVDVEDLVPEPPSVEKVSTGETNTLKDETTTDEEDSSKSPSVTVKRASDLYPPSFFTDDRGNLKFVNLVCRHPCKMIWAIIFLCLAITVLLGIYVRQTGNPFAANLSEYDMSDIRSTAYDSLLLARDQVQLQRRGDTTEESEAVSVIRPQEEASDSLYWLFESETEEGLFGTRESIQEMKDAFDLFTEDPLYEEYCQLEYETDGNGTTTSQCAPLLSPLNMYYASEWDAEMAKAVIDELARNFPSNILRYNFLGVCVELDLFCPPFLDDEDFQWATELNNNITRISDKWDGKGELNPDIEQVTMFAAYMGELNTKRGLVTFGFDKDFNLTNPKSVFSRGIIFWGGPLGGREIVGGYNETDEEKDDAILKEYLVDTFLPDMQEIATESHHPELNSYYFMGSLILEILFDAVRRDGALAFFSFLFVCVYIRISLGSCFLAAVGLLEILLSIPVSWFVFSVIFRIQYFSFLNVLALFIVAAIGADDIFIFMDAYKQSARPSAEEAYILESLESRMSWVYRRTGSAMLITSATTCLAFLCTLATPLPSVQAFGVFAALVIFVDYVLVMTLFCTAVVVYHNKLEKAGCCSCCGSGCCSTLEPSPTEKALEDLTSDSDSKVKGDRIGNFFGTRVSGFILDPKGRLLVGVIFIAWLIVSTIFASQLKPTEESEEFLDENHPLQKSFAILGEAFNTAENDIRLDVFFAWGLGDVDRNGVNRLMNPDFFGTPVYSDTFRFDEECQLEMAQVCEDLRTNISLAPYIKQQDGLGQVKCFVEEFGAYSAIGNLDNCESVKNGAWKLTDWTVPPENLTSFMEDFLEQPSCNGGFNNTVLSAFGNEIGWDGTALKYASISVQNYELDPFSNKPEPVAREQYDAMIELSRELDARMEEKCGTKVIMTDLDQKFTFMNNQTIYVRSAVFSALLGVLIAFVVLFISTRLFHIALLATLSIASVLLSVTGIMVMIGWELGSVEGILISVVAGFSVDYVVHLAHAYEQAEGDTAPRIRKAFRQMGISVLNGMVTSVGASIPLFFCQLQFFKKFGTFLCVIIAFSWIFANIAFMSVLAQLKIPVSEKRKMFGI